YHFSQGDIPDKTVDYGLRLAKSSLDAFSAEEAARSARTPPEVLDEEWEGDRSIEGEARMLLAQANRLSGDIDGALAEAEGAVRVFEREGHERRVVGALMLAAEGAWQGRRVDETSRWANEGIEAARAVGEIESLRHLLSFAATIANPRGEYEKANELHEEAARLGAGPKEADAEEEVPRGGKLVVALANPVHAREPVLIDLDEEGEVLTNVFETLLSIDREGNVSPALCEKWEVRDEGRSFLLKLRNGVRFQDGHAFTAADVKESFVTSIRHASREIPAAFAAIRGVSEFIEGSANDIDGLLVHS